MFCGIIDEQIVDFLKEEQWKDYRGTSSALRFDNQLLHNNLGKFLEKEPEEVSDFLLKVSDIAKAQIQEFTGILSSFESLSKLSVSIVSPCGKRVSKNRILDLQGRQYTDADSWNQEEYLLYHFVVLTLLYLRVRKGFEKELEVLNGNYNPLCLLVTEMRITINAYKICKLYIFPLSKENELQEFIQSYTRHVLDSDKEEHCFPCGSRSHAVYLVLIHYQGQDKLLLRIDDPCEEKAVVLEKSPFKISVDRLISFLRKVAQGLQTGNHVVRLNLDKHVLECGFTMLGDGGYPSREKQHMPNCSVAGFRIQMRYRLDESFYEWLVAEEERFTARRLYLSLAPCTLKRREIDQESYKKTVLIFDDEPKIEQNHAIISLDQSDYNPQNVSLRYTSFAKIDYQKEHLVDKTLFIKRFMGDMEDVRLQLITRPRGFGKTLNMIMLYEFLSKIIEGEPNPYKEIFKHFAIGEDEAFFEDHFARYHVIFFTLKDVDASDYNSAFDKLRAVISEQYKKFSGIEKNNSFILNELHANNGSDEQLLKESLQLLVESINKNSAEKVIILIDQYDYPLRKSTYDIKARSLILEFLANTLEGDYYKGLLMGISRVIKEGLSSGFNHCKSYTVQDDALYYQDFGMTTDEIREMISWKIERMRSNNSVPAPEKIVKVLSKNYGGYLIGRGEKCHTVYTTLPVMHYFTSYKLKNYWEETGIAKILCSAVQLYKSNSFSIFQKLHQEFLDIFKKGKVTVEISIRLSYEDLRQKKSIFWAILVNMGLMTVQSHCDTHDGDDYSCTLIIPNKRLKNWLNKERILWFKTYEEELLQEYSEDLHSTDVDIILLGLQKLQNVYELDQTVEEKSVALLGHEEKRIREAAKATLESHCKHITEMVKNQYIKMLGEQHKDLFLFAWEALYENWLPQEENKTVIQRAVLERWQNLNSLLSCLKSERWLCEEIGLEGSLFRDYRSWECYRQNIVLVSEEIKLLSPSLLEKCPEWIEHETARECSNQQVLSRAFEQYAPSHTVLRDITSIMNDTVELPQEAKVSSLPIQQASDALKQAISDLVSIEDFTFTVRCYPETKIVIVFTAGNSVIMNVKEIRDNLVRLSRLLIENLSKIGLQRNSNYKITPNWETVELTITGDSSNITKIIAVLEDAGQAYWDSPLSANFNAFFFSPQKRAETQSISEIPEPEKMHEISCSLQ